MSASKLALALTVALQGSVAYANDVAAPTMPFDLSKKIQLALGTTANKSDLVFADTRTLAASATENLDLAGGLTGADGASLTFVEVTGLLIIADAGNTNDVVVGGAASNALAALFGDVTDKVVIKPGGVLVLATGADPAYPVVATTGDLLKVANSGGTTGVTYTIVIIGRSA